MNLSYFISYTLVAQIPLLWWWFRPGSHIHIKNLLICCSVFYENNENRPYLFPNGSFFRRNVNQPTGNCWKIFEDLQQGYISPLLSIVCEFFHLFFEKEKRSIEFTFFSNEFCYNYCEKTCFFFLWGFQRPFLSWKRKSKLGKPYHIFSSP